jgi:hypothetical protein
MQNMGCRFDPRRPFHSTLSLYLVKYLPFLFLIHASRECREESEFFALLLNVWIEELEWL